MVPCLGFGENEIFTTVYSAKDVDAASGGGGVLLRGLFRVQKVLQRAMTFSLPILTNVVPHRTRVAVVVGKPLHVDRVEENMITEELVERYHSLYVESLRNLYDAHKCEYGIEGVELEIL